MNLENLVLILAWLAALGVFVWCLWIGIPALAGLPYIAAQPERIRRALEMAQLQPGETVYDLGAGDGRVLVIAANAFCAQGIGIEISPLQSLLARWNVRRQGLGEKIKIRREDFYRADLSEADVVYAYMTSRQAEKIRPVLERQLRPGTRVVAVSFEIAGWQPDEFDEQNLLSLYRMPPTPGSLFTYLIKRS